MRMEIASFPQRVKRLRKATGMKQEELAEKLGVNQGTVSKWERGRQEPEPKHMDAIADLESDLELASGNDDLTANPTGLFTLVPVVGHIGAGATVYPIDVDTASRVIDWVKAPRGIGPVECVVVRGNSMWPAYRDGDIVFVDNNSSPFPLIREKEYILELSDGRQLLKMVEPNRDGTYNLLSHNAPPENGVQIVAARRVRFVRKS
jgi:transcriptional regulator with XRE-family HTH domain